MSEYLASLFREYKNKPKRGLIIKIRNSKELTNEIIELTNFFIPNATLSERVYCVENNITSQQLCICGEPLKFRGMTHGYYGTCGKTECKNEKSRLGSIKGNKERDWNESIRKMQETNLKKYGHKSNFFKGSESMKKFKETMKQKYNVESPLQNKNILNKAIQTCQERYGVDNYTQTNEYKVKFNETIINKYGSIENFKKQTGLKKSITISESKTNILKDKLISNGYEIIEYNQQEKYFKLKCPTCGKIIDRIYRVGVNYYLRNNLSICPKCGFHETFRSNFEKEIVNEISKIYDGEIQLNRKYLGTECDILMPDMKLAIECNGIYWHNEFNKPKNYHINKKKLIEDKGFNLIQIWEDDWKDSIKKQIVLSRIKSKLQLNQKIFARNCSIRYVNGSDAKSFLEKNHLQGYAPSSINLGLYYNNELISIATFIQKRKPISGNKEGWELLRYCCKIDLNVVGGFSKLIKYFIKNHSTNLFSYSDCDWCSLNDNSYSKIGFKQIKLTQPNYWWVVNGIRYNRLKFTKASLVKQGFDSNLTEEEIMHQRKCYRVYGSGNVLFEYGTSKN